MALATANGTERNRLVRDQLFPVDFYIRAGRLEIGQVDFFTLFIAKKMKTYILLRN